VRLLLDTHSLLWWLTGNRRLQAAERQAISDPASFVHVSAASIWEISIKASLGRIEVKADLQREMEANQFLELPIQWRHARAAGTLPRHHSDPFDRMLIAQAQTESLHLVTYDPRFRDYDVQLLPARRTS
jgi:PIN domain nuclease of toxin-antitoxin system